MSGQTMCECGHAAIEHYAPHGRCVKNDHGCPCVSLVVVGSSAGKSSEPSGNPAIDADIAGPPLTDQLTIDDALADVIPSRSTDPETSHAAAREIRVKAGTQRARLLWSFMDSYNTHVEIGKEDTGLTDEQAMNRVHPLVLASSEYAKRCSELREGGFIEATGETRAGSAGPQRIVSRITDKGRAWIEANR